MKPDFYNLLGLMGLVFGTLLVLQTQDWHWLILIAFVVGGMYAHNKL